MKTTLIITFFPPLFSGHTEYDDNPEKNNDFRQASVNLKEILKNPGVWDPFILSYVEVNTYPIKGSVPLKI